MINLRHSVLLASCTVVLYVISCKLVHAQRLADDTAANGQHSAAPSNSQRSLVGIVDRYQQHQQQQQQRQQEPELHWTPVKDYKPPIDQLISSLLINAGNFRAHQERDLVGAPSGPLAVDGPTPPALPCVRKSTNFTDGAARVNRAVESTVAIQTNITRLDHKNSSLLNAGPQELNLLIDQEGDSDDDDEAAESDAPSMSGAKSREAMDSHESVSLESSIMPPPMSEPEDADEAEEQLTPSSSSSPSSSGGSGSTSGQSNDSQDDQEPGAAAEAEGAAADESAERREQEAAEAAEAEAADRSALDEQQQAQRQIILAQAQSEAKAIREQQEALLRQQQLQQQMLLKRHQNDLQSGQLTAASDKRRGGQGRRKQSQQLDEPERDGPQQPRVNKQRWAAQDTRQYQQQAPATSSDIQFSDQLESSGAGRARERAPDGGRYNGNLQQQNRYISGENSGGPADDQLETGNIANGRERLQSDRDDEMGVDYSIRKPVFDFAAQQQQLLPQQLPHPTSNDLLSAAQHHYGAHYGSLHGHHKGHYYQFAESHKKGQFDSGFKRGGKKFQISGHSSQHKSHAEGHVKWSAKKGKGMQYWDYKHKGKKGYHGHGHGYGY